MMIKHKKMIKYKKNKTNNNKSNNNKYGYLGKPKICSCGGIFNFYDGCLGFETLICNKCNKDLNDKSPYTTSLGVKYQNDKFKDDEI